MLWVWKLNVWRQLSCVFFGADSFDCRTFLFERGDGAPDYMNAAKRKYITKKGRKAMKKMNSITLILTMILTLCLAGCGKKSSSEKPEPITLTKVNVGDYISIRGEYKNGEYHSTLLGYVSTADLDFQAYSTVSGTFDNVEITVRANLSDKHGAASHWHLVGADDETEVDFTFKLPASGEYSSSYKIECDRYTWALSGNSDLTIIRVSGTFTPNN